MGLFMRLYNFIVGLVQYLLGFLLCTEATADSQLSTMRHSTENSVRRRLLLDWKVPTQYESSTESSMESITKSIREQIKQSFKKSDFVRALAFQPPNPPSYSIVKSPSKATGYKLVPVDTDVTICDLVVQPEVFYVSRPGKDRMGRPNHPIAAYRVRAQHSRAEVSILYHHTSCVDIGQILAKAFDMVRRLECDFITYDFTGYGQSIGVPSEEAMLDDAECMFAYLRDTFGVQPEKLVMFGESLGSVPALYLATQHEFRGVILQCAIYSGIRRLLPYLETNLFGLDSFRNIDRISKVQCLVLFIHGEEDDIVPIKQVKDLYRRCTTAVAPLWLTNADHHTCHMSTRYFPRIRRFLYEETLPSLSVLTALLSSESDAVSSPGESAICP